MTRKSYKLVAEAIKDHTINGCDEMEFRAIRELTDNLATIFKLDNPKFDRDKFLSACGF